jgi:predicted nuclease of predicted toxin-antitoxin system
MKILIDMNLSPLWAEFLNQAGHEAVHWSTVGDARATDAEILRYGAQHGFVIFSHDLDFAALLAAARHTGPSVLQVRTHDVLPDAIGQLVLSVLEDYANSLESGALMSVDWASARVRILPIK